MTFLLNSTLQLRSTVAEWLACWVRHSRAWVQIAAAMLSDVLGKLFTPIVPLSPSSKIASSPLKGCRGNCRPGEKWQQPIAGFRPMTHVTCRLSAKIRDQLRNPTLSNRVRATFTFFTLQHSKLQIFKSNSSENSFTEPSRVSPVQQQASYDSVFHQLQQAQHHCWQST